MNEDDWNEIVQLVQEELARVGRSDIADLRHYENWDGDERGYPDARTLVKLMLDALDRELSVRSPVTISRSLSTLNEIIDAGDRPSEVVVWSDPERSAIEGRDSRHTLIGDDRIPEALEVLRQLIGNLLEMGFGGELQ